MSKGFAMLLVFGLLGGCTQKEAPKEEAVPVEAKKVSVTAATAVPSEPVQRKLQVEGMTCGGCVSTVTHILKSVPGVEDATVSLETGVAEITCGQEVSAQALIDLLEGAEKGGVKLSYKAKEVK